MPAATAERSLPAQALGNVLTIAADNTTTEMVAAAATSARCRRANFPIR